MTYTLLKFPETLAIVRLGPGSEVPPWAESSSLFSVTATAHETSLICAGRDVPKKAKAHRPLAGYCVEPLTDGAGASVLVNLLTPLAAAELDVYTVSTHDTVWLLVGKNDAEQVEEAWRRSGYEIEPATPAT